MNNVILMGRFVDDPETSSYKNKDGEKGIRTSFTLAVQRDGGKDAGADFIKLFPCIGEASAYVKALCAPFNHIRFLAVGGVHADNVADFIKAGAVGVGVGSSLVNKAWVDAGEYEKITEEAKRMIRNMKV